MRWIGAQGTRQVVLRLAEPPLVQQHGGTAELGIRSLRRRVHAVALVDSSFRQRRQGGGELRGFGRALAQRRFDFTREPQRIGSRDRRRLDRAGRCRLGDRSGRRWRRRYRYLWSRRWRRGLQGQVGDERLGQKLVAHPDHPAHAQREKNRYDAPEPLTAAALRRARRHRLHYRSIGGASERLPAVEVLQHLVHQPHAGRHHQCRDAAGVSSIAVRTWRRSAWRPFSAYTRSSALCARIFTSLGIPRLASWIDLRAEFVNSAGPEYPAMVSRCAT